MKKLTIFRSPKNWKPDLSGLHDRISTPGILGYAWKIIRDEKPYITVGDNTLLVCELQKKLLPASVINRELKTRVENMENNQGHKFSKKQIRDIKEQVTIEMHEKAFITSKLINVWIDIKNDLLCIETTSNNIADDVIKYLIRDIGYDGHRIKTDKSASIFMRQLILSGESINGFSAGRSCALQDTDKRSIKYKNEPLYTEEIKNYLSQGKIPVNLEVYSTDNGSLFTVNEGLVINKITLPDLVENEFNTADEYFDNEFMIRSGQCSEIILRLLDELGEIECN